MGFGKYNIEYWNTPEFETNRWDQTAKMSTKESGGALVSVKKDFSLELIVSGENNGCE